MQLKIFDRDYKATNEQMRELLKKADLESHGYKKELVTKVVSENGSDKQLYEKSFFYYKIVDCTRLKEISQELESLLQGKIVFYPSLTCFLLRENRRESTLEKMVCCADNFND